MTATHPTSYRTPYHPAPIEPYDLAHPAVPPSRAGLTILHISDHHVTRPQAGRTRFRRILHALSAVRTDLVVLTGDYMTNPGDEPHALDALARLSRAWNCRLGAFGIFGNHDSSEFIGHARQIPGITWLENESIELPDLCIAGASHPEDLLGAILGIDHPGCISFGTNPGSRGSGSKTQDSRLLLALSHMPTEVYAAADLGVPILLSGHTHGGQFRVSARYAPHTSSDMPPHLASGMIRLRDTLCCISRGIGDALVELRVNCPPQIPLYTLVRGPMPGGSCGPDPEQVVPW